MNRLLAVLSTYLDELSRQNLVELENVVQKLWAIAESEITYRRESAVRSAILSCVARHHEDGSTTLPPRFESFRSKTTTRALASSNETPDDPGNLVSELKKVLIKNTTVGFPEESLEDVAHLWLDETEPSTDSIANDSSNLEFSEGEDQ